MDQCTSFAGSREALKQVLNVHAACTLPARHVGSLRDTSRPESDADCRVPARLHSEPMHCFPEKSLPLRKALRNVPACSLLQSLAGIVMPGSTVPSSDISIYGSSPVPESSHLLPVGAWGRSNIDKRKEHVLHAAGAVARVIQRAYLHRR